MDEIHLIVISFYLLMSKLIIHPLKFVDIVTSFLEWRSTLIIIIKS